MVSEQARGGLGSDPGAALDPLVGMGVRVSTPLASVRSTESLDLGAPHLPRAQSKLRGQKLVPF